MRNLVPRRSALLLVLLASAALARDREKLTIRTLLLSEHPDDATHRVYVKGQVVTVLRFERPCAPDKTRLLGWEGRFEPLTCAGRHVVVEPLRDLAADEAVSLLVTLTDNTEIPFLLRPPRGGEWGAADQQVNVFKDRETYQAMSSSLNDALRENMALRAEVERLRQEETSADHALAALLAAGGAAHTPFKIAQRFSGEDADAQIEAVLFRGKSKAAVVFKVKNLNSERSWSVQRVRLTTLSRGDERVVAHRATSPEFAPGTSGVVAIVMDGSAFVEEGELTSLLLELYRQDGLRQAFVQLDPHLIGK
jgi:hypothetical protein